jgi:hypothetical protein
MMRGVSLSNGAMAPRAVVHEPEAHAPSEELAQGRDSAAEWSKWSSAPARAQASSVKPLISAKPTSGEVKVTLASQDLDAVLATLGVSEPDASKRSVYFFDTSHRSLESKGVILRARVKKKGVEITVKLRGQAQPKVPQEVTKLKGYKAEREVSVGHTKPRIAVSLEHEVEPKLFEKALEGKATIGSLFSADQKKLLRDLDFHVAWPALETVGPIKAKKIDLEDAVLGELQLEAWSFETRPDLIELSAKTAPDEVEALRDDLAARLDDLGLELGAEQTSKTAIALAEHEH